MSTIWSPLLLVVNVQRLRCVAWLRVARARACCCCWCVAVVDQVVQHDACLSAACLRQFVGILIRLAGEVPA
jgi:hypothetical protein